jgi:hypothetical protein
MFRTWIRPTAQNRMAKAAQLCQARPTLELLEDRMLLSNSQVGDVFVILMENHNWTQPSSYTGVPQIQGNPSAPYINNVLTQIGAYANNYENAGSGVHPSEPNYIWLGAGTNFTDNTDADPGKGTLTAPSPYAPNQTNLFDAPSFTQQLDQAGISWKSYQEDLDINTTTGEVLPRSQWTAGITSQSGTLSDGIQYNYAVKHNPDPFFTYNVGATAANGWTPQANDPFAIAHNQPLQQFYQDLLTDQVGKFNYITPDQYNDMHSLRNGSTDQITQGDLWLSQNIPIIMASKEYKHNGVILVVWDETEGGDTSQFTVPFFLISPLAKAGYSNDIRYSHSSTLKTLEELYGVGALSNASQTGYFSANDLGNLFKPGVLSRGHDHDSFQEGDRGLFDLAFSLAMNNEPHEAGNLTPTARFDGSNVFTGLLPGVSHTTIDPDNGLVFPGHHHHRSNDGDAAGYDL